MCNIDVTNSRGPLHAAHLLSRRCCLLVRHVHKPKPAAHACSQEGSSMHERGCGGLPRCPQRGTHAAKLATHLCWHHT